VDEAESQKIEKGAGHLGRPTTGNLMFSFTGTKVKRGETVQEKNVKKLGGAI